VKPTVFDRVKNIFHRQAAPEAAAQHAEWDKKLVFSLAKSRFPSVRQLAYLPRYLSLRERVIVRTAIFLTVAAIVFLSARFYQRHIEILPREGGEYVEALIGQPQHINPALAGTNDTDMDLARLMYSSLLRFDEKQQLVTDLAERYEISEDKKTYTVILKQNIRWHDGEPLTADDVLFTVDTIQNPVINSPLLSSLKGVTVEKIDDQTVKFTITEPFAPFLSSLTFGILPVHIWGDVLPESIGLAEFNIRPVGSGPYQFASLQKNRNGDIKSYTLKSYRGYHGQVPYISTIMVKFYPDFDSALEAAKNKNVDGVSFVPRSKQSMLARNDDILIRRFELPQYTAIFFNQKNGLMKDKSIRQAFAMAVDRQALVTQVLGADGTLVNGPIPEGFIGYSPDISIPAFDPVAARKILDDNKWAFLEGETVRKKGSAELRFTLTTVDQPDYVRTAELLKAAWESINVGVTINIVPPTRFQQDILRTKNYEALLYGELIGSDPDPFPFWHSSQSLGEGLNLSNYFNKNADKLLQDARQTTSLEEREKMYIEFQKILADDLPALFLFSPSYLYAVHKDVRGIDTERVILPTDRLNGIAGWYIKTRRGWK
jgi:peptide/nickel transport system substrate-binding protein